MIVALGAVGGFWFKVKVKVKVKTCLKEERKTWGLSLGGGGALGGWLASSFSPSARTTRPLREKGTKCAAGWAVATLRQQALGFCLLSATCVVDHANYGHSGKRKCP